MLHWHSAFPQLQKFLATIGPRFARILSLSCAAYCVILVSSCVATSLGVSGSHLFSDVRVSGGVRQSPPTLVFACDDPTKDLERILSQAGVISDLKQLNAGISLALPDLSASRAKAVQTLNQAGIAVTAWLTLPVEQGYYLNSSNARAASARFVEFEKWSAMYGLRWAGVGLDIEPNIQDFAAVREGPKWRIVAMLAKRYVGFGRVQRSREEYAALVGEIHASGFAVETYQFPFIADERKEHSTLLERLAGIVDVHADREALMIYTSFNPSLDSALIWAYGPDADAIAIGSTSGPESNPHFAPLDWQSFSRDLIVAHHFARYIGVYNLEGSVRKGFLHRLVGLDWDQTVVIPEVSVQKAERLRTHVQGAIWIASNLPYFIALVVVLVVLAVWRRQMRKHVPLRSPEIGR